MRLTHVFIGAAFFFALFAADGASAQQGECRMGSDGRQVCGFACRMGSDGRVACADTDDGVRIASARAIDVMPVLERTRIHLLALPARRARAPGSGPGKAKTSTKVAAKTAPTTDASMKKTSTRASKTAPKSASTHKA